MMLMQQQQGQGQAAAAARGFSPPPNVTAPGGMESPIGGPAMNQPGQQGFNYGGNYGELTEMRLCVIFSWMFHFNFVLVVVVAGMNQQGDPSFMAPVSSPPANMMQGRMAGPPQTNMMPGMQGNPQGGAMYPSGEMKGWTQGGIPRSKYVPPGLVQQNNVSIIQVFKADGNLFSII